MGDLGLFLRGAALTTAVFAGISLLLLWVERRATARGMPQSLLTAFIVALAYGVHNVGGASRSPATCFQEPWIVRFSSLWGSPYNATEGFGIAAPLLGDRRTRAA